MEWKPLASTPRIEDVIECLYESESVFAVYEDLARERYSVVAWTPRRFIRGSDRSVLIEMKEAARERRGNSLINVSLIGYIAYDAVRLWERLPDIGFQPESWDYVSFFEPENVMVYDYSAGRVYVRGDDSLVSKCRGGGRLEDVRVRFYDASHTRREFEDAVEETLRHITEGRALQVVISRFERYTFEGDLPRLYARLRRVSPSPHSFFLKLHEKAIIGASPESLFIARNGVVETNPIGGTRPRGVSEAEDRLLEEELLKSEKDIAEHIMLVDLARNDLCKACKPGTVRVDKLMYIEKYSFVQHLVSGITGVLREKKDVVDLVKAMLPAGTVSGAPKLYAMKLIEEIERFKRGPYAGVVGFISSSRDSVLGIAIRSAFIHEDLLRIQAGAGIVYGSKPSSEFEETEHKLRALKLALGIEVA